MKKRMLNYLWLGMGVYALVCSLLYLGQRRLIYMPSRERFELPVGFGDWTGPEGQLLGYRRTTNSSTALVFLHGNAGNARGWAEAVAGFPGDVYVLEYPGYGQRPGRPTELALKQAALAAFDLLPPVSRLVVCGQSLGAGVAEVLMRQRHDRIYLLILITPFTSLADMARAQMPFLPTQLLLKDRMPVLDVWRAYAGPSRVLIAEADEVIPRSQSLRFSEQSSSRRRVTVLPHATHNTVSLEAADWERLLAP